MKNNWDDVGLIDCEAAYEATQYNLDDADLIDREAAYQAMENNLDDVDLIDYETAYKAMKNNSINADCHSVSDCEAASEATEHKWIDEIFTLFGDDLDSEAWLITEARYSAMDIP